MDKVRYLIGIVFFFFLMGVGTVKAGKCGCEGYRVRPYSGFLRMAYH